MSKPYQHERERVRRLYLELESACRLNLEFEERFHIVELDFALETLLPEPEPAAAAPSEAEAASEESCLYCLFVNQKGIRHLRLTPAEAELARKIKSRQALSRCEKAEALKLLRKLG
jgi:hypothetical protein